MTDRPIPLAGVIGSPVAHSKSPRLHAHWLKTYGLPGYYIPMDVAQADLREVLEALPKAGFVGCNITIPHKETVLQLADVVTDRAALIGAANTLIFRKDGRIHADNTDGYGFIANLQQNAPDWDAKAGPAAIFGAGRGRLFARVRRAGNSGCEPHPPAGRSLARRIWRKDHRL